MGTKQQKSNRCLVCNKRLFLLPFVCKCGVRTCGQHKWPEHECTYDYHAEARERLRKDNPQVIADRLNRI